MPKRNARSGFPSEPSRRSNRAVSTLLVSSHSKPLINQSSQEESVIRSDEVASSAPAKRRRARTARWRGMTVGVASLTAMLGTALVPGLGSAPAGATGPTVTTIAGHSGLDGSLPGRPGSPGLGQDQPHLRGLRPLQRRHGRGLDTGGLGLRLPHRRGVGGQRVQHPDGSEPDARLRKPHLRRRLPRGRHRHGRTDRAAGEQPIRQLDHGGGHGEPDHADVGRLRSQRQPPHRRRERIHLGHSGRGQDHGHLLWRVHDRG